jgi:LuxR family maltose regulon positive regulatory protein
VTRPLLETKLHTPTPRKDRISRPRLLERLNRGLDAKLTLVSAPAGFGKTSLLADWLVRGTDRPMRVAWLALDHADNHAASFWSYVIAALQKTAPGVGAQSLDLLEVADASIDVILGLLINDLSALPDQLVLVLDDYHLIEAQDIHAGLVFLLEHLPPSVHVVIASRADPSFPLARLRARGDLVELRAADLRFTPDEAAAYLNTTMGLGLSPQFVASLEDRTEGWIAALQLAALSMQGRDDVASFIAGFAGNDRYIVDYLVEEVLLRQPEDVRSFLLQTSILERLSGPLCDAVTGLTDGKRQLEALERANLFVVRLDDRREWYRYHHLFADVLRAHLADEQPDSVQMLHRRASEWYQYHDAVRDAVQHAFAARDLERAADLVELAWPDLRNRREEQTVRPWLSALPDEVLRARPVLSNAYGGVLLTVGEMDGVDARLRDAERWLASSDRTGMVVVDHDEFRTLPGSVALHRAGFALAHGDLADTAIHARHALERALAEDHLTRGGATALLGLAAWATGDLDTAYQMYAEGMANVRRTGHLSGQIGSAVHLADIRIAQGRIREAMRTYEQALQLAAGSVGAQLRGVADMYVGMSELYREWNDLDAAIEAVQKARGLGDHMGFMQYRSRWRVTLARIHEAQGDLDAALLLLQEAEPLFQTDFAPNARPIAALRARALVRHGRVEEARVWARVQGLSTTDDLSYLREFEHITLARVLVADGAVRDALALLDRLRRTAEDGRRNAHLLEILLLQALVQQSLGDAPAALTSLECALRLAEPEGYIRAFVDEGAPMATLLQTAARHHVASEYVKRLLRAYEAPAEVPGPHQALDEPLSERELEVLRLLGTELDGPEIASELMVSLNTMRTHTKNIYSKLGVNNRRAAVRRAEELQLLATAPNR